MSGAIVFLRLYSSLPGRADHLAATGRAAAHRASICQGDSKSIFVLVDLRSTDGSISEV